MAKVGMSAPDPRGGFPTIAPIEYRSMCVAKRVRKTHSLNGASDDLMKVTGRDTGVAAEFGMFSRFLGTSAPFGPERPGSAGEW